MKTTVTKTTDTTLFEALSINTKLAASVATQGVGYASGAFVSLADTAQAHAHANKGGYVDRSLTTSIKDQFMETKASGYNLMEGAKDMITFTDEAPKTSTETKTEKDD